MKKEGILCFFAAMLSLGGCTAKKPDGNIMDGDGMEQDFYHGVLQGDWTELRPGTGGTISFPSENEAQLINENGEQVTVSYTYTEGSIFKADDYTVIPEGEGLPYDELVWQNHDYEGHYISLLYCLRYSNNRTRYEITRVYIFSSQRRFVPDDYYPAPWQPAAPYDPDSAPKIEPLVKASDAEYIKGVWQEISPEKNRTVTFSDNTLSITDPDTVCEYEIPEKTYINYAWPLYLSVCEPYEEMLYQPQLINGNVIRLLFGVLPIDGGDPYQIVRVYVRQEEADLIPDGYRPELSFHPYTED